MEAYAKQSGVILPPLREKPRLFEHLVYPWEAFWTLNPSRRLGFGSIGPIPLSEIIAYFNWQQIADPDEQDDLLHYIRILDTEYMRASMPPEEPKGKPKSREIIQKDLPPRR